MNTKNTSSMTCSCTEVTSDQTEDTASTSLVPTPARQYKDPLSAFLHTWLRLYFIDRLMRRCAI